MRLFDYSRRRRRRSSGQALVEFSLIIPIFMLFVVAIAEFAFLLTIKIGVTDAAQDAVQLAAQLGNTPGADCTVLQLVEKDMGAPTDRTKIRSVAIFWTDVNSANKGANTYIRSGTLACPNGGIVPYSISGGTGYPTTARCNIVSGAGCVSGHNGVDWIGVTISYQYAWITPLPAMANMGSAAPLFVQTSTSRLEPIQ